VTQWNSISNFTFMLFLTFGILPILGLVGIFWNLDKGDWSTLFVTTWAILPFLLLPFINFLGMGKIRVVYQAPFVPLGILATQSIFQLSPFKGKQAHVWKYGGILLFLVFTIPTTIQLFTLHYHYAKTSPTWYNEYLLLPVYDAINYTNTYIPKNSNFISPLYLGGIFSSQTLMHSFVAHLGQTINYGEKYDIVQRLFNGELTQQQALDLFRQYHISYVYVGWLENRNFITSYSFISTVYQNPYIAIYRIN